MAARHRQAITFGARLMAGAWGALSSAQAASVLDEVGGSLGGEGAWPVLGALAAVLALLVAWLVARLAQGARELQVERQRTTALTEALAGSESYGQALLDALPDLVFVIDRQGRLVSAKAGSDAMLLASPLAFVGEHYRDVFPGPVVEVLNARLLNLATEGLARDFEFEMPLGGESHVFESRLGAIDESRALMLCRDITARRQAEAARAALNRQLRQVIDLVPSALFAKDLEGRYVLVNAALAAQHGRGIVEMIGRTDAELGVEPGVAARWQAENLQVLASRRPMTVAQQRVRRADGGEAWYQTEKVLFERGNGLPDAVLGVSTDITAHVRDREALERERARLQIIVEGTAAGTWIWWVDSGEMHINEQWAQMLGYTPQELEPISIQTWERLSNLHDLKRAHTLVEAHLAGQLATYEAEVRMRHREGHWVWVLTRGRVVERDENGAAVIMSGTHQDITARKWTEQRLRESEAHFRRLVESLSADFFFFAYDRHGRVTYFSPSAAAIYGWEAQGPALLLDDLRTHHPINTAARACAERGLGGERQPPYRVQLRDLEGHLHWVEVSEYPVLDARGQVTGLEGIGHDVTQRVQAEQALIESERRFRHLLEDMPNVAVQGYDTQWRINFWNRGSAMLYGWSAQEAIGRSLLDLIVPPEVRPLMERDLAQAITDGRQMAVGEYTLRHRNGAPVEVYSHQAVQRNVRGELEVYCLDFDIGAQKRHQQHLEHLVRHDVLTGLPNRLLLTERLREAMALARESGSQAALALVDLDGFKAVNDRHGHAVGDACLRALAERIGGLLRPGDTLARLGGDEFGIVMGRLGQGEMDVWLQRLAACVSQPVALEGLSLLLSASMGVTVYPQADEFDAEQLLRQADQAMYVAKQNGKNRIRCFDAALEHAQRQRFDAVQTLRQALEKGELVLFYQPKVDLRQGRVLGVEALVRWLHPQRGLLPPSSFLPLLEGEMLALQFGDWVVGRALADQDRWQREGLHLPVSVNITPQHLLHPQFLPMVRRRLAEHPSLPAHTLTVEILETSLLEDLDRARAIMVALQRAGVGCSLDDFGTGYSSLRYLKHLPLAELKIDQSFVRDMLDDPDDMAIIQAVIGLAHTFGIQVVAEGVETAVHARALLALGCRGAQGYGIARPMPATELATWVRGWRPDPAWTAPNASQPPAAP